MWSASVGIRSVLTPDLSANFNQNENLKSLDIWRYLIIMRNNRCLPSPTITISLLIFLAKVW